jgi:hypothetical protein
VFSWDYQIVNIVFIAGWMQMVENLKKRGTGGMNV